MRNSKKKRREKQIFEVVPLIDIMMILTLFFAVLAFLPQIQSSVETKLPKSTNANKVTEAIVVTINSKGNIYLDNEQVSKNELLKELKKKIKESLDKPLLLAADNSLKYDRVISILDILKNTGAKQVGLVTDAENTIEP